MLEVQGTRPHNLFLSFPGFVFPALEFLGLGVQLGQRTQVAAVRLERASDLEPDPCKLTRIFGPASQTVKSQPDALEAHHQQPETSGQQGERAQFEHHLYSQLEQE